MQAFFKELDAIVEAGWAQIKQGDYWKFSLANATPPALYQQVMLQVFHYTRYNSVNQAACAFSADPEQTTLLRFVYKHALEELGHERMVLRDLEAVGLLPQQMPAPLAPTQALIAFLNDVAIRKGPIARLGYSYWAEDVYEHIQPVLERFRNDLKLKDEQMTFFVAHSTIDEKHSEEVRVAMERAVKTEEDRRQIKEVARVTLWLTGQLLEEALRAYLAGEDNMREAS
ncbi:TPA: iron-containing redox enzyme family protein [Pseudomonas putida]|uniref:iron-containing redox enzyme family protein n=1 Tax=Pseudomonas TaxID=286 RepID=UPI00110D081F|nr:MULTISPECIES: iron-containing redox enzyme family protein [Pseudomonas]MDD1995081.1 iron-containing redox enzyme family protein [Pseudomonas putida]HDS0919402.1 iron-containing redox enzyme family protein [Pseudomonas putida]HDS0933790.1 iron-containing redox enzyme family protein [Pseudomonas putida]HDS1783902.1 iron-containing redox enzyme family protein [Pseudomonas putida]HDS3799704.1 iron-containing redox enzyme family protein [Pseudomonas putida]